MAYLKDNNCIVAHVVSPVKFAIKAEACDVDAIVAEGFEAGGHNGREETTTMTLIPLIKRVIKVPLIAAGVIGSGEAMLASMALGANAVQVGSRFVATPEASSHPKFKEEVIKAQQGSTVLTLKELTPVRLIKNQFYEKIVSLYENGSSIEELREALGRGRAKKGMFEGDLVEGELEIGQVSAQIDKIIPASEIIEEFIIAYNNSLNNLKEIN